MKKLLMAVLILVQACTTPAEKAAKALASRIVPQYRITFRESRDTVDSYRFFTKGSTLVVEGSSANAMAAALGRYLRDYAHTDISWYAHDALEVPDVQPVINTPVCSKALVKDRFFLNYCTFGYTMPWWQWEEWEHFIDWMALQGINLPLSITGQDAVWQEVWRQHGLTDDEIRAWFTGPAHLPWHRMCNIDGVDGPLPQSWIDGQKTLQQQIVKRERELGMRPVLPAFAGHVPGQLKARYPQAQITDIKAWCGFPGENLPHFLSPEDTLYYTIQRQFLEAQTRLYGTDHVYGWDLFNEVEPPSWDPGTLARIGKKTYDSVAQVDPEAVWIQMGWMFYNDRRHWTPEIVKAYLEAIPQGKVSILDYYTENIPIWESTERFYGQPFIFCYLGNFGGNTRFAGPFRKESQRISEGLQAGAGGIGCTLEGFGVNRWFFEYVMDRAWESQVSDDEWLAALDKRRGSPEGFWKEMADSIYLRGSFSEGPLLCGRPCLEGYRHWTVIHPTPYDNTTLVRLWKRLLEHPSESAGWRADAVTLGTQALGNHFATLRDSFTEACRTGNRDDASWLATEMQELLSDVDSLAACLPEFRLNGWLSDAERWGRSAEERDYYRQNAWNLVTVWARKAPVLNDYASRVWSGLVKEYYAPRWNLFLEQVLGALDDGIPFDQKDFDRSCRALEEELAAKAMPLTDTAPADAESLCRALLEKWFPEI